MTESTNPPQSDELTQILEKVRKGGYYDGFPDEREPDYLDTDVARTAIIELVRQEVIEAQEPFHPYTEEGNADIASRNILRQEQNAILNEWSGK